MEVKIRRAEPRDVPRMLELVRELAVFERAPNEVTVTEGHMRDAGFGNDPVWVGWVAELSVVSSQLSGVTEQASEVDGMPGPSPNARPNNQQLTTDNQLVGMAVCYERYSTWKGRRLYLEDIIVTEAARGQRIGEKLFIECAKHAVEQNYSGMLWQVLDWNTDAIRFYDRFGASYSAEWLNGSLELDQLKNLAAQ